ncbi:MAG: TonB family protein [Treponema sp.]|nr:TonB family protein [Treponema sp.]
MTQKALFSFKKISRPALFAFVLILHAAILICVKVSVKAAEEEQFVDAELFKLVDVEEYVPPPPPVVEKQQIVVNEVKASETIQETEKEVIDVEEDIDYVPQHKISVIPEIPTKDILSKIEYPQMAMKQGIEGTVYLELFIDKQGIIKLINVLKDPGYGFADAALAAMQGIKCKPAYINGSPCAVRFRYPIRFCLK